MFEKYVGIPLARAAELLCCDVLTPSVEMQAQSALRNRQRGGKNLAGYAVAEAALREQQMRGATIVRDWMLAHPGETPDLNALLAEG